VKIGVYVLGVAAIATGIVDLVWGDFEHAHEPIQAWGDNVSGRGLFADAVAIALIAGGIAIMMRRRAQVGAILLTMAYFIFALFWAPRLYTATEILGWRGTIGAIGGVGQQAIVIAAAAIVYASAATPGAPWGPRMMQTARSAFGISTIFFGLAHLTAPESAAPMVPTWIPPSADFWVIFTGLAFVAAGIGVLTGILDVLAARLLTLMFLVFAAVVLPAYILRNPHNEIAWGGNAYNLVAVGAAWVLADWLASRRNALRLQTRAVPSVG
jgi:uncharacterized membrane protein